MDLILGKRTFIAFCILKSCFPLAPNLVRFASAAGDFGQSFSYLLGCLHFKDVGRFISSRDKECKFYPGSFSAFRMVIAVPQKCSNSAL